MKRMKMNWMIGIAWIGMVWLAGLPAAAQSNLCYNGSFTSTKDPFEGWNLNYDWTGNSKQMGNHTHASFLAEYNGRRNVLKMVVPGGYEGRVETPLIACEPGARYKCTFDLYADVGEVRMLFQGYTWRPGIAPNEAPKLQELRRIYKGDAVGTHGASWKPMTVIFPHEQISELAYNHLKKVRFMTVLIFVPGGTFGPGTFYISNMKIVKLPDKYKVIKGSLKSSGTEE